jgi:hypothetical protein
MGQIFKRAEEFVEQIKDQNALFLEIGSARMGDDQSTSWLAELAQTIGTKLVTVDLNREHFQHAGMVPNVDAYNSSGEQFLMQHYDNFYPSKKICFAYMDNFDWDWHPEITPDWIHAQIAQYKKDFGITMNNVNSQAAHLLQAIEIERRTADKCLIIFDDTFFNKAWGDYSGKGGAAVPYLVAKGFNVVYTEEYPVYGTILTRGFDDIR